MTVTWTGAWRSALAARKPPKPAPTITTRGSPAALVFRRLLRHMLRMARLLRAGPYPLRRQIRAAVRPTPTQIVGHGVVACHQSSALGRHCMDWLLLPAMIDRGTTRRAEAPDATTARRTTVSGSVLGPPAFSRSPFRMAC